MMGIYEVQA